MTQFLKRNIIQFINNIFFLFSKILFRFANSLNSYGNLKREISQFFYEDHLIFNKESKSKIRLMLNSKKLVALDVGGLNGLEPFLKKYSSFFKILVCEPFKKNLEVYSKESLYKKRLKEKNLILIDKALGEKKQKRNIYIYNESNNTSFYKPDGKNLNLLCQMQTRNIKDAHHYKKKRFRIKKKVNVEVSSIYDELKKRNIRDLDYLKIDTEGSELEILKGLKSYRPILVESEISNFELRKGQSTNLEIELFLKKNNYIPLKSHVLFPYISLPFIENKYFILDFTNRKNQKILKNRITQFKAILIMLNERKLLSYLKEYNLK